MNSDSKQDVPSAGALEEYYRSIEKRFREAHRLAEKRNRNRLNNVLDWCFTFSLIPLIPLALYFFVPVIFKSQSASFAFWWATSALLTLLPLIGTKILDARARSKASGKLSARQMSFAYCYGILDEIQRHQADQVDRHIDDADVFLHHLSEILRRNTLGFDPALMWLQQTYGTYTYKPYLHPFRGRPRPRWIQSESKETKVRRALWEFLPLFHDRLNEKRELATISTVLSDLAEYLYIALGSTHPDYFWTEKDYELLERFADAVVKLPPYRSKYEIRSNRLLLFLKLPRLLWLGLQHPNSLLAFICWWVVIVTVFGVAFSVGTAYFGIGIDSEILIAILAAPPTIAIAIVKLRSKSGGE
ncbi:MAG: hypothetical protein HYX72_09900 [Acidobacteria bacterium]|nr:hypothetical protein [Acidobacteriota bacterium]